MRQSWPFLTKCFPGLCCQSHGEGTKGPFPPNLGTFGKQNLRATLLSLYLLPVAQPTESVLQELECVSDLRCHPERTGWNTQPFYTKTISKNSGVASSEKMGACDVLYSLQNQGSLISLPGLPHGFLRESPWDNTGMV